MSYEIDYQHFTVMIDGLYQARIITGSNNEYYASSWNGKAARGRNYQIVNQTPLSRPDLEVVLSNLYDRMMQSQSYRLKQKTKSGFINSFFVKTFTPDQVLDDPYKMDLAMRKTVGHCQKKDYLGMADNLSRQPFSSEVLPSLVGKQVVFYWAGSPNLQGKVSLIYPENGNSPAVYGIRKGSRRFMPIHANQYQEYVVVK